MTKMNDIDKRFPEGMEPLENSAFQFRCGPDVKCYMSCCRKLDLILYPYDIIRLKNRLSISSEEFMRRHGIGVIHGGTNSLRFTPHFAITSEEVDLIVDAVRQALTHGPVAAASSGS